MKEKKQALRILFLEENNANIQLVESILRESLPEFEMKLAKTEKEFQKFIIRFNPDVILSGYHLEKYSASEAFELMKQENYPIPFIIVTNKLSEDVAGELIKKGVEDCVFKTNLAQLPLSILKAIDKKRINTLKETAENLLKQEQDRLETIYKNTAEAIINIGFDGEILEINPTGLSLLQVDVEHKLNRKAIFDFIHPDDIKRFKKFHNSAGIGNKKTELFRMLGSKKEEHWVETNAIPLFDEDKHVVSVLTINRDVTEKLKAQQDVIYQATLLANVSDAIISFGPDRFIVSWNPAAEKLLGWKAKEVKGKLITDILHTEFLDSSLEEVLKSKKERGWWRGKLRVTAKNGQEIFVDANSSNIINDQQEVIGSVTTYRDITEQLKSRDQINYNSKLFENISDAVISLDNEFIIRSWNHNAEEIYGWKSAEAVGKKFSDLSDIVSVTEEERNELLRLLLEKGQWRGELEFTSKDGKEVIVLASISVLKDDVGSVSGFVAVHRDITLAKQSMIALKESHIRLKAGQEIANIGYWDRDLVSGIGIWSKQMFKIFEKEESETAPSLEEFLNVVHPDDRESVRAIQKQLLDSNDRITHRYRLLLDHGKKVKHILAFSQVLKNERDRPYKLMGTTMDVTELMVAKAKAELNETKFRELFENSPDAIYVEDELGTILDANEVACKYQGYDKKELIGKNILDLVPAELKTDLSSRFENIFNQDNGVIESFIWHRKGQTIPVEIKSNRILYNQKPAALLHARDISKRRMAEKAKRDSDIKFKALNDQAPVAIYHMDNEGQFLHVNAKFLELFELTVEEIMEGKWKSRVHPEDLSRFMKGKEEVQGTDKELDINYRLLVDKQVKHVYGKSNALLNAEGVQIGRIGTITDLTEIKKSREQMKLAQTVFQSIFEHSPDSIFIEDIHGTVLNANQKACSLQGLDIDELIGKNIRDLVAENKKEEVMMNHKKFFDGSLQRLKSVVQNKDGKEIQVEVRANLINYFDQVALLLHISTVEE